VTEVGSLGPAGGTVKSDDCGLTLTVPPGALTSTVTITMVGTEGGETPVPGRVVVSRVCTVLPPLGLSKPATVTMTYDPAKVPARSSATDADLRFAALAGVQVRLQELQVDTAAHQATATTLGTGGFWVTTPGTPAPATVNITPSDAIALLPGQTQQYSAQVVDTAGATDTGVGVRWATSSSRIATIAPSGLLTAVAPGHAFVTASTTWPDGGLQGDAGAQGQVDLYVLSPVQSPGPFGWENPRPMGEDIHGLATVAGQLLIAGDNGTLLGQLPDGGYLRLSSQRGLSLAGVAVSGTRAGVAGTLDLVSQGVEQIAGVLGSFDPGAARSQVVAPSALLARAVYGDADGLLAVGSGNDVYLLDPDGGAWAALETPVSEALLTAAKDPVSGRRVVGARGQVYRQEGLSWFPIWDEPLGTLLSRATVLGADAFAIDEGLGLRHFQEGHGWASEPVPAAPLDHLVTVDQLGGTLALSGVDTSLVPHVWLRPQAAWEDVPGLTGPDEIYALTSTGPGHGYVGGARGALYDWNGSAFAPLRTGPVDDVTAVSVAPDGAVFATTAGACQDARCLVRTGALLARGADGQWAEVPGSQQTVPLWAVVARSATDVFFGGGGSALVHYDGQAFTPLSSGETGAIRALKQCGADLWATGDQGFLGRYDGAGVFQPVAGGDGATFRALGCSSARDVWAVGDYAVWHFDGNVWASVVTPNINAQPWRAVSVGPDEVWIGGETGFLLHSPDHSDWEAVLSPAGVTFYGAYGLWESEPGDLYLVGSQQRPRQAVLLRFDGALWHSLDSGTSRELLAIDGSGTDGAHNRQMVVVGRSGAILKSP
jgi:hypothetical protein